MTKYYCRFCKNVLHKIFLDLGKTPLANSYLKKEELDKKEPVFPLCAYVCEKCFLVQVPEFEKPENIFSDYAYFSSYSESWIEHVKNYVDNMITRFNFDNKSQIIEIEYI